MNIIYKQPDTALLSVQQFKAMSNQLKEVLISNEDIATLVIDTIDNFDGIIANRDGSVWRVRSQRNADLIQFGSV